MFLCKDFGYDDFDKNLTVVAKFAPSNLSDMMGIQQALEKTYNGGGAARPSAAAASQSMTAQPIVTSTQPQVERRESIVEDQAKIKYAEKVNKKLKDPQRKIMLQLMEFGYLDYDKNYKIVKKEKKPDISAILDTINQAK